MKDEKLVSPGNPEGIDPTKIPAVIVAGETAKRLSAALWKVYDSANVSTISYGSDPRGAEILNRLNTCGISVLYASDAVFADRKQGETVVVVVVGINENELRTTMQAQGYEAHIIDWYEKGYEGLGQKVADLLNSSASVPTLYLSIEMHSLFGATPDVLQANDKFVDAITKTVQSDPIATVGSESFAGFVERLGANAVSVTGKDVDDIPPKSLW